MELWAELLVRDSNSVLGEEPPDGSGVADDRTAIVDGGKSREASDDELRLMLKSATERLTGERVASEYEDVDGLTRRILKFQLDRRRPQDVQLTQCFGPM